MANSPHPGGSKADVGRDEPNKRGGAPRGNRGEDRGGGDKVGAGNVADDQADPGDLTRGAPPKPRKRYSHAG